jgi:alginate O-acetyltransferase complex protein AlgI
MLFNSYLFLYGFLPLVLIGYYGAAHWFGGARTAKIWLCAASFVFYGSWNPALVFLLLGSIGFNYFASRFLVGEEHPGSRHQGRILFLAVAVNLLVLFYYKYLFPLIGFFHRHGWTEINPGSVILPIGISFFTFTQIGYLVDCRQGQVRDRGFLDYMLFVTFFPHLIAGPILHHREIMPQFASDATYRLRADNIGVGLTLFAVGLAKKVLLADSIAPWVDLGFADLHGIAIINAWSVAAAYSMQLYFDFSGYSDMAIGLGIMFAIRLPLNFDSPYRALSIIDFWQRWHMTLTRYVTLLVYNPLSLRIARYRQRRGLPQGRRAAATLTGFANTIAIPTFATTLLVGIWHGAGMQFVVYGALHGVYLSVNHAWRIVYKPFAVPAILKASAVYSILWRVTLTYTSVLMAMILFRAQNLSDAMALAKGMFGFHGAGLPLSATVASHMGYVLVLGVVAFGFPNIYQMLNHWSPALTRVKPIRARFLAWRPTPLHAAGFGVLLAVAALYSQRAVRFLYFQF